MFTLFHCSGGRFTPSGGGRSRRAAPSTTGRGSVGAKGRGGSSKPSSRAESEEPASAASSESESSDNESEMSKVQ